MYSFWLISIISAALIQGHRFDDCADVSMLMIGWIWALWLFISKCVPNRLDNNNSIQCKCKYRDKVTCNEICRLLLPQEPLHDKCQNDKNSFGDNPSAGLNVQQPVLLIEGWQLKVAADDYCIKYCSATSKLQEGALISCTHLNSKHILVSSSYKFIVSSAWWHPLIFVCFFLCHFSKWDIFLPSLASYYFMWQHIGRKLCWIFFQRMWCYTMQSY